MPPTEITGICLLAFRALKQGEQGTGPEPKPRGRYLLAFKSQAFDNDLQVGATHVWPRMFGSKLASICNLENQMPAG